MVPPGTEEPNGIASLFEGLDKGAIKNLRRKVKRDKRKAKREAEAQKKAETAERMKALNRKNKDKYDPIKGKLIRQEEKRLKALGIVPKWKKAKAEAHKRAVEEKTARKVEKKAKKQALNDQKERQRELSKKLQRKRELGIVDDDDENPSKKAKRDPAPLLIKLEGLDAIIREGWPLFSKDNIDQKSGSYMNNKARRKAVRGYEQTVKKAETLRKRLTKQGVEVTAAPEVPPNPAEQQEMTKKERRKLKREQQAKNGGEGGGEKKESVKKEQKVSNSSSSSDSSDSDSDSDDGSSDGEEAGGIVKAKKEKADSSASESESDSDNDDDDTSSSSSDDDDDGSDSDSESGDDDDNKEDGGDNDDETSSSSDDDSSDDDDDDTKDSSSSEDDNDEEEDEPQPKHQKTNKGAKASTPPPSSGEKTTKKKTPSSSAAAVVVPPPPAPWAEVGDRTLATTLPPLTKALYSPHSDITAMPASEVEAFQTERRITLHDSDIRPILSFPQSGLSTKELSATKSFAAPSPIQAQCLPVALSGRDLVGIAATGSGKTLAFGLPALRHIRAQNEATTAAGGGGGGYNNNKNYNNNSRKKGPQVLILAPTRELALQIHAVLEEAGRPCGIASVCIYGGVPKRDQLMALRNTNPAIAVATPGRLEDLMSDGSCRLDNVSYLVLDEADRMLDLGFEPAIRKIAGATRADRQTLMFSATWPSAIRKLASEFLSGPARVTIGSEELSAARSVKQTVEVIEDGGRDGRLHELLQKHHVSSGKSKNNSNGGQNNRVIVFVLYKKEAARVEEKLTRKGWKVAAVHGDLSQAQRSAAVEAFKAGTTPLLVATDVAARGLDIPDVEVVINYSFPLTVEDYVHRIGRTGRAGKSGISHTFFVGANDKPRAGELINVLKEAGQAVPEELYKFGTTVKKKESKMYGAHFRDVDHTKKATKMKFGSDSE